VKSFIRSPVKGDRCSHRREGRVTDRKPQRHFRDSEEVEKTIHNIQETGRVPDSVKQNPGQFVRALYEIWIKNGGKIGGRYNRNSLKRMKKDWLQGEQSVNSLYPKLAGKSRLTRDDTDILLRLFLGRWRYEPNARDQSCMTPDGYVPFSAENVDSIVAAVISAIFGEGRGDSNEIKIQIPRVSVVEAPTKDVQTIHEFVENYHKSAALFTFSRERTIVGHNTTEMMNGFWHFCDQLYQEDQRNPNIEHQIIWVIDIGSRIIDREDALKAFYNAGFLAMQFVAFANFEAMDLVDSRIDLIGRTTDQGKEERKGRWNWLKSRACIFVENLRPDEYEDYFSEAEKELMSSHLFNIGVTADHVLPRTVPSKWKSALRELHGRSIKNANDTTFTANLRRNSDNDQTLSEGSVQYTAYARVFADSGPGQLLDDAEGYLLKSVELGSPGEEHDDGIRLLYRAARHVIKDKSPDDRDGALARAYLMKLGFQAFDLRDFVQIFWSSVDLLD